MFFSVVFLIVVFADTESFLSHEYNSQLFPRLIESFEVILLNILIVILYEILISVSTLEFVILFLLMYIGIYNEYLHVLNLTLVCNIIKQNIIPLVYPKV